MAEYGYRERALHPARRRRPGHRPHRRVRHAAARLRRVPRLPAQRRADGRRSHRERPAARQARAPQRGARRARRARAGRSRAPAASASSCARSVRGVVELMEADGCQVFILRNDTLYCVLTYDDGEFLDDYADRPLDLDLFPSTRSAIAEKTALVIESPDDPRLSDYERELYRDSGTQSEICVPLVLEDRVVGLLDVYDHRRRDYAEHRDFLLRVGQMMAGAFENALLMERLEESNQTLGLLVESGIEFGATLDRDEVLRERRSPPLRRDRRAQLRHLHAARRRHPLRRLHRPRRAGPGLRRHGVPARAAGTRAHRPRVPAAGVRRGHRHRPARQRLRAAGGPQLGAPRHARASRSSAAARSSASPASTTTTRGGSSAPTSCTASPRWPPARSPTRRSSTSSTAAPSAWRSSATSASSSPHRSTSTRCCSRPRRRLCAISGAPMCDIYTLRDGAWLESVISIDEGEVDARLAGPRVRARRLDGDAQGGGVARAGRHQSRDDPDLSPAEIALMEQFGESGALMVPLISSERVIGVLELTHREPQRDLLAGRDGDDRLHLPLRRARHRQRRALRRHQGHAPQQPQGPELGAQRQGLLHARPRRPRRRLHGAARQGARLAGRAAARRRGGGVPARHRQDRHLGPGAAQAERPQPARVGADAPAPHLQRRHHPAAVRRGARGRRAPPPRALRRRRLPGRPRRRGHPGHRPRHVRRRLLRRDVVPAPVPAGPHRRGVPRGARALQRRPVRPRDGGRVPPVLEHIAEGRRGAAGVAGRAAAALIRRGVPRRPRALRRARRRSTPRSRPSCARCATAPARRAASPCTRGTAGARSCWPTRRRAAGDAAPRRRGRQRRRARRGVRRPRAARQRPVRRRVGRLDQRGGADPGRGRLASSPSSPPTSPRPRASPRSRACAATWPRPSPRCCTTRRCSPGAPRSTPSPTASPASTTTATSTSA